MVIEWLRFKVEPSQQSEFIRVDQAVWTTCLQSFPGFLSKEIWTNANSPDELIVLVRWRSIEDWYAIAEQELVRADKEFRRSFPYPFQLLESLTYQPCPTVPSANN